MVRPWKIWSVALIWLGAFVLISSGDPNHRELGPLTTKVGTSLGAKCETRRFGKDFTVRVRYDGDQEITDEFLGLPTWTSCEEMMSKGFQDLPIEVTKEKRGVVGIVLAGQRVFALSDSALNNLNSGIPEAFIVFMAAAFSVIVLIAGAASKRNGTAED